MSKASDLREMNDEQLKFALEETRKDLFDLRFQSATEKIDGASSVRRLRRQIARILTIQTERAKSAGETSAEVKEEATA